MKTKTKITIWDKLKINLMCKWMEDYGFEDLFDDCPDAQVKFSEKLNNFL